MNPNRDADSQNNSMEKALSDFYEAWSNGENPDPDEYCKQYKDCDPELREQIEDFLLVAETLPKAGQLISDPNKGENLEQDQSPGKILGDFKIIRLIGSGGMGKVYEAEQISLKRRVALKILPSHLSISNNAVQKFKREAEAGGRQSHPGIVVIHAVGEYEGVHYIAQEFIEHGLSLSDKLKAYQKRDKQPLGYFRQVAKLLSQVADALGHAHESGVIHRDIKPSNILLTRDGKPKISDFGLARVEDALSLSRTGDLSGTPYYMSPEQAMSKRIEIDHRTDIYSLGVTLYEMLTLKRPFEGNTSHEILKKILINDPKDPQKENPEAPRDLSLICLKAIEKKPKHRYQSMKAFFEDLQRFLSGDVILAKPPTLGVRMFKLMKRRPVASITGFIFLIAIVSITSYTLFISYPQIKAAEEEAKRQRLIAETQRDKAVSAKKRAMKQRKIAEEQRRIAEMEKKRAFAAEAETNSQRSVIEVRSKEIKKNYDEILRLSDVMRLSDLKRDAKYLWPAYPKIIPDLEDWLGRADDLRKRLEEHQKTLESWRENHLISKISDIETQWRNNTLASLVSGIEELYDEDDGIAHNVRERLDFATTVYEKSITDYEAAWDEAIASIANKSICPQYNGLVIEPVVGLVPINRDPSSGLWEFAHLQTGEIPKRDTNGKLMLFEKMGLVFVLIPGGVFNMGARLPSKDHPLGSPNVDPLADPPDEPVREVAINPFFISKYEMTQGQWLLFTGKNPSIYRPHTKFGDKRNNLLHPVELVNWDECSEILFQLNLRLPTEEEWEYAARAGTTSPWWTGNHKSSLKGAANLKDVYFIKHGGSQQWEYEGWLNDGYVIHAPVGTFSANAFGLHNMIGNVQEWCEDVYIHHKCSPSQIASIYLSEQRPARIMRGGSWGSLIVFGRPATRDRNRPDYRHSTLGVRPALSYQ